MPKDKIKGYPVNGDRGAFPENEFSDEQLVDQSPGLTKREYFAGLAMQAILANSAMNMAAVPESTAEQAIKCADELLKELNQ